MENRKQAKKKSNKVITNAHIDIEIILSPNFCFHSFFLFFSFSFSFSFLFLFLKGGGGGGEGGLQNKFILITKAIN